MKKQLEIIAHCIEALIDYKQNKAERLEGRSEEFMEEACMQALRKANFAFTNIAMRDMFIGYKIKSLLALSNFMFAKKTGLENIEILIDQLECDLPKIKKMIEILPK